MLLIILTFLLTKDPDQSENVEEDAMILDAMVADQPDCGEAMDSDQPSYGKDDGMIKVRYEIELFITKCSRKLKNDQSIDYHTRNSSVLLEEC